MSGYTTLHIFATDPGADLVIDINRGDDDDTRHLVIKSSDLRSHFTITIPTNKLHKLVDLIQRTVDQDAARSEPLG